MGARGVLPRGVLPGKGACSWGEGVLFAVSDVPDVQEGEGAARRAWGRLRWPTYRRGQTDGWGAGGAKGLWPKVR